VHFEVCHRDRNYKWAKTVGTVLLDFQTACIQTLVTFKVWLLMPLIQLADRSALWDTFMLRNVMQENLTGGNFLLSFTGLTTVLKLKPKLFI
jgi:hypothetical protein